MRGGGEKERKKGKEEKWAPPPKFAKLIFL